MRTFALIALLFLQVIARPDSTRVRRAAEESSGLQGSGESSGVEASGTESSGEASGIESSGESSGIESSGESSGIESSGESSGIESSGESSGIESSGEFSGTESSGESSGTESSGEGSGLEGSGLEGSGTDAIPAGSISLVLVQQLDKDSKQLQAEADKLVEQTNAVVKEINELAINTIRVSDMSKVVALNSQILLQQASVSIDDGEEPLNNSTCSASSLCFNDNECGSGKCVGAFVGTCNCNTCINFFSCASDAGCGGLQGACQNTTATCDCFAGFAKNGFPTFLDALNGLCNVKTCGREQDSCFGLPCNSGQCAC